MDDAGIDVQILSYPTPSAERLEPSLSRELTGQANDTIAATVAKYPELFLGFATTCIPSIRLSPWSTRTTAASLLRYPRFTTDWPYGSMKATRQFFDQMPINVNEKEKIAHLNAERLLGLGQKEPKLAAALSH
jgi:predicted TIM-barrel fold metal-dependent hydrolase